MGFYQIDARSDYFDHYIGVALGVYSAARQYKFSDRVITGYSYLVYIIPAPVAYFVVQQGATAINTLWLKTAAKRFSM